MPTETELRGRRVRVEVQGESHTGTITAVTYTLKGGQPVVRVELDEPTADGKEAVPCGLPNVEFGD